MLERLNAIVQNQVGLTLFGICFVIIRLYRWPTGGSAVSAVSSPESDIESLKHIHMTHNTTRTHTHTHAYDTHAYTLTRIRHARIYTHTHTTHNTSHTNAHSGKKNSHIYLTFRLDNARTVIIRSENSLWSVHITIPRNNSWYVKSCVFLGIPVSNILPSVPCSRTSVIAHIFGRQ